MVTFATPGALFLHSCGELSTNPTPFIPNNPTPSGSSGVWAGTGNFPQLSPSGARGWGCFGPAVPREGLGTTGISFELKWKTVPPNPRQGSEAVASAAV